jgi:hypothetical protein
VQVFDPRLEEIRRFGREEIVEPILEISVVNGGNSTQIVGQRVEGVIIRWGKVWSSAVQRFYILGGI